VIPNTVISAVSVNFASRDWRCPNPGISGIQNVLSNTFSTMTMLYRRLFPTLRVRVGGLVKSANYVLLVDVVTTTTTMTTTTTTTTTTMITTTMCYW